VPTALKAFCNATSLKALLGDTIQADSEERETLLIGDIVTQGHEGLFVPVAQGDLPTFEQRNFVPLFLNGMMSEYAGTVLIPVFPPFQRGPGVAPQLPGGQLWVAQPFQPGPTQSQVFPINYYLAGAAGVPNQ